VIRVRARSVPAGDDGASAVEYGLIVFAIAALIVVVLFALGGLVRSLFDDTCTAVSAKTTGSCS
jgi:pilus assembly protein Flp/PilA